MQSTIIINQSGLNHAVIAVTAESTTTVDEQMVGSQMCAGLSVDDRFYPLAYKKHLYGRPELSDAINQAWVNVQVAIDALQPTEPTYDESLTAVAVKAASWGQPAPVEVSNLRTVPINHDALLVATDQAKAVCTDPRWVKALTSAYEWLSQVAFDGGSVVFDNDARMAVDSHETPGLIYWVGNGCQCEAHQYRTPCWHQSSRQLVCRMLEVQASQVKPVRKPKPTAAMRAKVNSDMAELFIS